jgi:hypothetical protein
VQVKKLLLGMLLMLVILASVMNTVSAADTIETRSILISGENAPEIDTVTFGGFPNVTLDGTTQLITLNIPSFTVTDATGTGSGWNVTLTATQFSNGDPTPKLLSNGSLTLTTAPSVALIDSGSSALETIEVLGTASSPIVDDAGENGIKLLSAAADGGMGTYTIGDTTPGVLTLTLKPKEVYAATYTSTFELSISSGP